MVNCELHRAGACVSTYQALNDVVVSKSAIARLNNSTSSLINHLCRITRPMG
jgi:hypothetical protein